MRSSDECGAEGGRGTGRWPSPSASLPEDAEEDADAGGHEQGLDRLLADVVLELALPLHGLLAPGLVVLGGGLAEVFVLLGGGLADVGAHVLDAGGDLGRLFAELRGGALGLLLGLAGVT